MVVFDVSWFSLLTVSDSSVYHDSSVYAGTNVHADIVDCSKKSRDIRGTVAICSFSWGSFYIEHIYSVP